MTNKSMDSYLDYKGEKKDELEGLPEEVQRELEAHKQLYLKDPAAAHMWDPAIIGVPGGPVKTLLLTYKGRKSGKMLKTVLQYYELDGNVAVIASRGGTVDHPLWYKNLVEEPRCHAQVGSFDSDATARTATPGERKKWWPMVTAEQPIQAAYQQRTSREIPIVILDFDKKWTGA